MKVVYLADAPYIHTRRWIAHSVSQGIDCDVISFRPAEISGARVHYINGAEKLGKARYLIHARRVRRLVRALKPDIVHALHLTSYGFLGALAGFNPLLISVWGTDILEAPSLTPFHKWLTRYSLGRADLITATGLHLATETTRHTPRGTPVQVVPYGVDLRQFEPKPRSRTKPVIIGTASRLSPEKGQSYLLEAFALLRERSGSQVSLRIAGEGPEERKLKALAQKLGIADAVEFAGWIDHADLPAFLQDLDLFALPSTYEGFGVAAAEAACMKLAVVASNVYGVPDIVRDGKTGILVPARDSEALAAALSSLIDDAPRRFEMGEAGRAVVTAQYDWRDNTAQMDRTYESVLANRGSKMRTWN